MKRFVMKAGILSLLVLASLVLILLLHTKFNTYLQSTVDKRRILEETPSPKIIFVGGSNLALGLDSELVEQKAKMNVVNMGVHAALGLRYMLEQVKSNIEPNDVVVVVPEYEQFSELMYGDAHLADLVVLDPPSLKYIQSPRQYFVLLKYSVMPAQYAVLRYISDILHRSKEQEETIYNREAFNKHGDLLSHLNQPNRQDWQTKLAQPTIDVQFDEDAIGMLNDFDTYVRSRGARAFVTFPPVPTVLHPRDKQFADNVYQHLKSDCRMGILSSPESYFFSLNYFYDNVYHLNAQGREIRTQRLSDDLNSALSMTAHDHAAREVGNTTR